MPKPATKTTMNLRLKPVIAAELRTLSESLSESASEIIREAIRNCLDGTVDLVKNQKPKMVKSSFVIEIDEINRFKQLAEDLDLKLDDALQQAIAKRLAQAPRSTSRP